jgi:ATP-dependent DNA ligase
VTHTHALFAGQSQSILANRMELSGQGRTCNGSAGGRRQRCRDWVRPQLTKLVDQPPNGPEWLHEIKFNGHRMDVRLDLGAVRLLTRTGLDWMDGIRR